MEQQQQSSLEHLKHKIDSYQPHVDEMYTGLEMNKDGSNNKRKSPPKKQGTFVVYGQSNITRQFENNGK